MIRQLTVPTHPVSSAASKVYRSKGLEIVDAVDGDDALAATDKSELSNHDISLLGHIPHLRTPANDADGALVCPQLAAQLKKLGALVGTRRKD